jgi:universal stress protein E
MKRFKNILLVVNDTAGNETAIQKSVSLSRHNQARLTVIKVLEESQKINLFFIRYKSADALETRLKEERDALHTKLAPYIDEIKINIEVVCGKTFIEIIKAVLQQKFDLVVKTCHQHGSLETMLFGTTDMRLLRKCPCPVWLIKPQENIKCHRILAAVDIEPCVDIEKTDALNLQIMEMATSLALSEFAELHIVHAWMIFGKSMLESPYSEYPREEVAAWMADQKTEIESGLDEFRTKLDKIIGAQHSDYLHPEVHFLEGDAGEVIPQLAKEREVDLVIMGTITRTGLPGFLMGNTAECILNQLSCSVLAIKPAGFISPVTLK